MIAAPLLRMLVLASGCNPAFVTNCFDKPTSIPPLFTA